MMLQICPDLWSKIHHYAKFAPTGVSLKQMVLFGRHPTPSTILKSTLFLRTELPIRLAHRVIELDHLPRNLSQMPSIQKVKLWYAESFKELVEFPPMVGVGDASKASASFPPALGAAKHDSGFLPSSSPPSSPVHQAVPTPASDPPPPPPPPSSSSSEVVEEEDLQLPPESIGYMNHFVTSIQRIKRRHDPVVTTMAKGIKELKETEQFNVIPSEVQAFLDRFHLSRIGIRMLIGQHVALSDGQTNDEFVGIISPRTNVHKVAQEAINDARFICEDHYALFKPPEVYLYCPKDLTFTYVPSHLHHMLFELLKNSLRAVVETFGTDAEAYPPVKIIVAEGKHDITIKIADEGGGIPRHGMPLVWTYFYTTADAPRIEDDFCGPDFKAPLAGLGFGLPLARLYARYFGGDLRLIAMEGYGTDAYLHLNRLSDSEEYLP